jgi:hypothetical protein
MAGKEEGAAAVEKPATGRRKWALLAAAAILVLGAGGGAAAYLAGLLGGTPTAEDAAGHGADGWSATATAPLEQRTSPTERPPRSCSSTCPTSS